MNSSGDFEDDRGYKKLVCDESSPNKISDEKVRRLATLTKDLISHGDLLFFRGDDAVSRLIEIGCDTLFSHVGTAIKVNSTFIEKLRTFIETLPKNWEEIGFSLLKENCKKKSSRNHFRTEAAGVVVEEEEEEKDFLSYDTFKAMIVDVESKRPYKAHIRKMLCAYMYLRSNSKMIEAIASEIAYAKRIEDPSYTNSDFDNKNTIMINYNKPIPHEEDTRELYMWESTTDEEIACLITGKTHDGVKLTLLSERTWGYENIVGIRRVVRTSDKFAASKGSSDLRLIPIYYGFVCNVMLNHSLPYQEDYADMLCSLCYVKNLCCCFAFCSFICNPHNGCYHCCNVGKLYAEDYHGLSEYSSFYCTELSMELLLDYMIMQWVGTSKDVDFRDMVSKEQFSQIKRNVSSLSRSKSNSTKHYNNTGDSTQHNKKNWHNKNYHKDVGVMSTDPREVIFANVTESSLSPIDEKTTLFEFMEYLISRIYHHVASENHRNEYTGESSCGSYTTLKCSEISLITNPHYNLNRNAPWMQNLRKQIGVPRTDVEMDFMVNTRYLPVNFRVEEIEVYKRAHFLTTHLTESKKHDLHTTKYR